MRDTRHGLMATLGGWVFGAALAIYVVVPWLAEVGHELLPVYSDPTELSVVCDDGFVILRGEARKNYDFYVADNRRPGWLEIHFYRDMQEYTSTYPFVAPDGEVIETRPYYKAGDTSIIGPFKFPYPGGGANGVSVSVVLPGYRWEALYTTETIGPIPVGPCV